MSEIVLGIDEYADRVRACWYGKNIGGTLGAPWEGKRFAHALTYYDPVPDGSAPNDDLDLQLIWLKMLEEAGTDPSVRAFAEYWNRYAAAYPWNEYGFFMRNYARGLMPPVAGCFENYYVDEEGSPIRSEIWACLHPADPQSAARMAWKDSAVDHAGGEGMYGEMFWAALESAAFVENDPTTLIRIGLNMIPLSSHLARSVREALWCWENKLTWGEARERLASRFGGIQPCHAVPNAGFIIIGWLYGSEFGDRLCKAVNCGYDTDCTGGTLGALLGVVGGMKGIPRKWIDPVGSAIALHPYTGDCGAPRTVEELTDRIRSLAAMVTADKDEISFGERTKTPPDLSSRLFRNRLARESLSQDIHAGVESVEGSEICFHYGGEPVLRPSVERAVWVTVDGQMPADPVMLKVPEAWTCTPQGQARFVIRAEGSIQDRNTVTVSVGARSADFTILGPGEARGFPAGDNVTKCARCHARVEACICSGSESPTS